MQAIGFYSNTERDKSLVTTAALVRYAVARGCTAYVEDEMLPALAGTGALPAEGRLGERADFIAVLGGDGTILRAAQLAARFDKPLIGFNLGNLGYLTDVEGAEATAALNEVLEGRYTVEKRMMLVVTVDGQAEASPMLALNDVCITRGVRLRMIGCRVHVNDDYIDTYHADGLIVCTPTGSTAYSLSAGGAILKPALEAMAITPVCPHALYARSLIVAADDVVRITTLEEEPSDVTLSLDGQSVCAIGQNATIRVTRAKQCTRILKTNKHGFYDILRAKMLAK